LSLALLSLPVLAQEFQAKVTVNATRINSTVDRKVFTTLQFLYGAKRVRLFCIFSFACIYFNFMRAARTYGAWIMLKQNAPEVIIENAEAFDVDPVVVFDC
jgi:hypothetical protein